MQRFNLASYMPPLGDRASLKKIEDDVVEGKITMDDVVNEACSEEAFCEEVVSSSTPDTSLCSSVQQSSVSVSMVLLYI